MRDLVTCLRVLRRRDPVHIATVAVGRCELQPPRFDRGLGEWTRAVPKELRGVEGDHPWDVCAHLADNEIPDVIICGRDDFTRWLTDPVAPAILRVVLDDDLAADADRLLMIDHFWTLAPGSASQ